MLKGVRNIFILAFVQVIYYRLNELFTLKSIETYQHKHAGFIFSEFATQRIEINMQCAGNIVVYRFDRRNEVFKVCEMPSEKNYYYLYYLFVLRFNSIFRQKLFK
ncbi:hypothetical protein AHAS_Ahas05G0077500 [Arachis hypogaea]